jgi:hypothetical protein
MPDAWAKLKERLEPGTEAECDLMVPLATRDIEMWAAVMAVCNKDNLGAVGAYFEADDEGGMSVYMDFDATRKMAAALDTALARMMIATRDRVRLKEVFERVRETGHAGVVVEYSVAAAHVTVKQATEEEA